ncbi:MAG: isochorismatase family protein [Candidatus Zixiibacteriota bacterium]|nr:MAG: isochorismatase family protein [candidate division Zixibacteria bacterium]
MKEEYLNTHNIAAKSQEFRRLTAREPDRRCEYLPVKSALMVLDMQRYFLEEKSHAYIPSAPVIVPGLIDLMDAYRGRSLPVILTRHLNDGSNAGMMDRWWQELITKDNPLSEIDDRFKAAGDVVVEKSQYDAFHNTAVEAQLRENNVTQVVVCGVMAHLCCETTARSAFMRGFEVFFPVDGTATYNEEFHKASLLNLSHGFAELVLINELLRALKKNDGR